MKIVRKEIEDIVEKYYTGKEALLVDRLSSLPIEVWQNKFQFIDLCLKDSIRIQLLGTGFPKNISGRDVQVGDKIIPNGAFVVCFIP